MTSITPEIDPFSLVFLLGAAQGMFLVLALLTIKQGDRQANLFLALFTLTFSLTLLDAFLEYTHYYAQAPWLLAVTWPTNYLYGPLLLLYTHTLIKKEGIASRPYIMWQFLPFALTWICLLAMQLQENMQINKLYLDNRLTLPRLTSVLETSPHYLCQAINGHNALPSPS